MSGCPSIVYCPSQRAENLGSAVSGSNLHCADLLPFDVVICLQSSPISHWNDEAAYVTTCCMTYLLLQTELDLAFWTRCTDFSWPLKSIGAELEGAHTQRVHVTCMLLRHSQLNAVCMLLSSLASSCCLLMQIGRAVFCMVSSRCHFRLCCVQQTCTFSSKSKTG